jgi:hypothetical protein
MAIVYNLAEYREKMRYRKEAEERYDAHLMKRDADMAVFTKTMAAVFDNLFKNTVTDNDAHVVATTMADLLAAPRRKHRKK